MNYFNVVIVGGGAAGLHLAGILAKSVKNVCLVDQKSDLLNLSFHTLGSFVDIERYGLSKKVIASSIAEVFVHSKNVSAKKIGNALILNKSQLHKELLEKAINSGVIIKTSVHIKEAKGSNGGGIEYVTDDEGNKYYAKIFVDASGSAGVFSKTVGLQDRRLKIAVGLEYNVKRRSPQNQAHLFFGKTLRGGYGWIFPLENNRAIAGFGTFNHSLITNLKSALNSLLRSQMSSFVEKDNNEIYGGTIPITEVKRNFIYKNVVCVGDSVSQVHPLVGEGYRFVLEAGRIAAPHIVNALKSGDLKELLRYEQEWNTSFYRSYRKSKFIQQLGNLVTKSDFLSDAATVLISLMGNKHFTRFLRGYT